MSYSHYNTIQHNTIQYNPTQYNAIQVENSLVQMLAGCLSVLKREGCSLVGGHTSEGMESAMGLSVSGIAHPDRVFHKGLSGRKMIMKTTTSDSEIKNARVGSDSEIVNHTQISGVSNGNAVSINGINENSDNGNSIYGKSNNGSSDNGHLDYVLVLTKGLGTGTIMAAHMRAKVSEDTITLLPPLLSC